MRRSTSGHALAERFFPVRVRVAVPPGGFGRQLDEMHGWLNMHVGRGHFAIHGAPNDLGVEAAFFYFESTTIAHAFMQRFACGVAVMPARMV